MDYKSMSAIKKNKIKSTKEVEKIVKYVEDNHLKDANLLHLLYNLCTDKETTPKNNVIILVKCRENLFGNSNFSKGSDYMIREKEDCYYITTNYEGCNLPCNLFNNRSMTKEKSICFGYCLFEVINYSTGLDREE